MMKIGVFDSGIGGVTVLKELRARFSAAEFVYLGDTAHVPYGTRSPSQVKLLAANCARLLKSRNIDALVVACNTASSLALPEIREVMGSVPVFGVVEPGIEAVSDSLLAAGGVTALICATRATVQSGVYRKGLIGKLASGIEVREQACPLLVPMIEEGWFDHPILHQTLREYVSPHLEHLSASARPGVALLACTHYPWIQSAFEKALPGWKVVNSAKAVAESLARRLPAEEVASGAGRAAPVEWIFTDPDAIPSIVRQEISS